MTWKGHCKLNMSSSRGRKSDIREGIRRPRGNITLMMLILLQPGTAHWSMNCIKTMSNWLFYALTRAPAACLTCALLPFAFALPALWVIRRSSLRQVEQHRQQTGGHQVPEHPAGTPATPPSTRWHHDDDPTSRYKSFVFRWKRVRTLCRNPNWEEKRARLPHAVSRRGRAQRLERRAARLCGADGGTCRELLPGFRVQEASEAVRYVQGGSTGGSGSIPAIRPFSAPKLRVFFSRFINHSVNLSGVSHAEILLVQSPVQTDHRDAPALLFRAVTERFSGRRGAQRERQLRPQQRDPDWGGERRGQAGW